MITDKPEHHDGGDGGALLSTVLLILLLVLISGAAFCCMLRHWWYNGVYSYQHNPPLLVDGNKTQRAEADNGKNISALNRRTRDDFSCHEPACPKSPK